jgi:hypothetical protein
MAVFIAVALTIPPAAKVLAVASTVYLAVQALKKIPALTPYLKGWWAVGLNLIFSVAGALITIPPAQLYTTDTANSIITIIVGTLAASGIHGTVSSMSQPQVLATIPPSTQVKEVPATLEPVNPAAVPVEPKK